MTTAGQIDQNIAALEPVKHILEGNRSVGWNGTRMTRIGLIFADQRKSARSASSAFYSDLHSGTT